MLTSLLKVLSCTAMVSLLLVSCSEPPAKIEAPVSWQAHLQEAKLPPDFVPFVSETVYVPIYSHIYHEDPKRMLLLVGTLSIRNTDPHNSLIIKSVQYYDTQGHLLDKLLEKPVVLGSLATAEVVVPRTHEAGGSGANFIVEWMSQAKVTEPIVEAVMISTGSAQSVSFTSRGSVIQHSEKPVSDKAAEQK